MGPKEALKESVLLAKTEGKSPKFQGKYFKYGKQGHRKSDYKSKKVEKQEQEKSPSTGPLVTPGKGKGKTAALPSLLPDGQLCDPK